MLELSLAILLKGPTAAMFTSTVCSYVTQPPLPLLLLGYVVSVGPLVEICSRVRDGLIVAPCGRSGKSNCASQ